MPQCGAQRLLDLTKIGVEQDVVNRVCATLRETPHANSHAVDGSILNETKQKRQKTAREEHKHFHMRSTHTRTEQKT